MSSREELLQEIAERVERFAQERGYALSEIKDNILNDIVNMYQRFGDFYCPCQPENADDTICVCTAVRQGLVEAEGACFCYLFVAEGKVEGGTAL